MLEGVMLYKYSWPCKLKQFKVVTDIFIIAQGYGVFYGINHCSNIIAT